MKCSGPLKIVLLGLLVEIIYITKGVLLIARYSYPPKSCPNSTELVESDDSVELETSGPDRTYYFTVAVYAFCSLLRCIEYIPLLIGLHEFWKDKNEEIAFPKLQCTELMICSSLAMILFLCLSVPAVGIALELNKQCEDSLAVVYIVYCVVNFFRYTWAFLVRAGMVFATFAVREIWTNNTPVSGSTDQLYKIYEGKGENVQKVAGIFQTWFLFPWIIFFIASSLECKNVLRVWNGDREEILPLPLAYYLLYNINQIMLLLIPYLCGLKMDYYHHKFYKRHVSCQTERLIQEDDDYNFVPCVWGLDIKVKMNSVIYSLFLLLGIFFTLCGTLF